MTRGPYVARFFSLLSTGVLAIVVVIAAAILWRYVLATAVVVAVALGLGWIRDRRRYRIPDSWFE